MNLEINNNDDIFDIAIAMQYFKNYRSSSDNIHTYAQHFLYKSVYQKLLSFSKEELETVFWDSEKKQFHENPKARSHAIKFNKNIFDLTMSLKNSLFFSAFIEKKVFKESYHPIVKFLLKNKNTSHSLEFLDLLFFVQTSEALYSTDNSMKRLSQFSNFIFSFCQRLDTEEKNEIFLNFVNKTIKNNPKDFVQFLLDNLSSFNEEHNIIINSKIKEHNIDINSYHLFESLFPQDNNHSNTFFINANSHLHLDNAYDFGFRPSLYQYKNLNLVSAIYSYGLSGNSIGDTWQINFVQKMLKNCTLEEAEKFTMHMGTDQVKFKKYGHHFENLVKEALNRKLHHTLPEFRKEKQPKI